MRRFIEAHGQSRFESVDPVMTFSRALVNRAGYRRGTGEGEEWWVLPETWDVDVCAGLNKTRTAEILADRGMLVRGNDGYSSVRKIEGRPSRVYVLTSKILAGERDE